MKQIFNVHEDKGGGLILTVFNQNVELLFIKDGFERDPELLFDYIIELQEYGARNIESWGENRIDDDAELSEIILNESTQLIADNVNFYWDRMGNNGYEALKYFERGKYYNNIRWQQKP